jgi:hypothetical protein
MTLEEYLKLQGKEYPKAGEDGRVNGEQLAAVGLPWMIACTGCHMTMAPFRDRQISEHGEFFCDECAETYLDDNYDPSPDYPGGHHWNSYEEWAKNYKGD